MRAFLLLLTVLTAACGLGQGPEAPDTAPNVVLVSVDTLRADRLGCYGREPSFTSAIDAFREDAVLFEVAIAQAPSTLSSHASLFTSLIPHHHGASMTRRSALAPDHLTLAEVLRTEGFTTAAFHGGGQLDEVFGLDQGFGVYETPGHQPDQPIGEEAFSDRFRPTVERALAWLEEESPSRFFLFLHTYEIHHPYTPSPEDLAAIETAYAGPLPPAISIDLLSGINGGQTPLGPEDLRHIESTYEAEIRSVDAAFAALVEGLRRLGLYDTTLIVFTSDHGEEFGEHGTVGWHSHTLYDELLRVPLLVKYPGGWHAGEKLDAQVRLLDVAPTVLGAVGVERPGVFQGANLTHFIAGGPPPSPYALSALDEGGTSLRTREWKRIRRELYDLGEDPGETLDVADDNAGVAEKLRRIKVELVTEGPSIGPVDAPVSPELQERLEALGYVQ
jgi:arylsulfatase A-like enzyme